ncbi:hypothetical protein [Streptomyces sp. NPDC051219]|uniref:hypothetical protein n=1 Tax=Streptomyces sp. NPDC051219 TaxID=3155283 RepID=UPI0034441C14
MRSALLTFRAVGAAAVLVAAPVGTAYAGEENRAALTVTPSTVAPGGEIELRATGCDGRTGAAESAVFVADGHLSVRDGRGSPLYGEAMITSSAQAGRHTVAVLCHGKDGEDGKDGKDGKDGEMRSATAGVQVAGPTHGPAAHAPADEPTHHRSPVSPAGAGGGGTATQAAADDGPSTPHTVVGILLAAAAIVAVAGRALRRRRRSD